MPALYTQNPKQLTPWKKKPRGPCCHHSIHSNYVVTIWQMSHVKWHFPFAFTPVEKKQSDRQTDGWQDLKTTVSPSHLVKWKEPGRWLFTETTWDGAVDFQALRMINGFANPVGLQTQMRMELIAVRNTLAWMERKCRRAAAKRKKRAHLLLWTPSWRLLTRVHSVSINHALLTAETALSHQHAIDWVTDSILTTLAPGSNEAPFVKLSNHLEPHRKWKPDGGALLCITWSQARMDEKDTRAPPRQKKKKSAYIVEGDEWQGSIWGILAFLICFKYFVWYDFIPRLCSAAHYSTDSRTEMWFQSVLHPHRWARVQSHS